MSIAAVSAKMATVGGPKVQLALAKVNQFSPQILTAVGIVGGVGSTFLIAKATLKLEPVIHDHEVRKHDIYTQHEDGQFATEKDQSRAMTKVYIVTGLELAKIYGPGVSLGLASILSVAGGQYLSQKKQVAVVAALKSAESALQAYRARVIAAIGEEKEAEIRYGISTETIEDEDGKKTKVKTFNAQGISPYMFVFDKDNKNYQRGNKELNFLWLKNMQNWMNDRLNARGFVYLNEVYSQLGIPEVPEGQVVGWLHKDFNNGDGYIDFGWDNPVNDQKKRFLDGVDDGILLDFNVDGEINSKL